MKKMIVIAFAIQSEFTGWYGSGIWHELDTIEILVIPGQTSVRTGDVTLLSWCKWWEDITELGWLALCSPLQAENGYMLEDCPYCDSGCELFKDIFFFFYSLFKVDIQNYVIVISLTTVLHLHRSQATSIPFQRFPVTGVQISCLA